MKHLIMGTAGHIDHGKTTLIQKLTGYNCDTHKEEQLRGITINLGFTNLKLSDDNHIGIIDVPGHKDFVNTMISGASGIDFGLLVIAADSGIMPQTLEHIQIMDMLKIHNCIVALTKTDLVDAELLELAEEEIREEFEGSFLENAPIVRVSAKSGDGISDLINEIDRMVNSLDERTHGEVFRMYIDRVFNVQGHGTVVNGTVESGELAKTDNLFLLPDYKELKIRKFEKFGEDVDMIQAGDRASINVGNFQKKDFKRGQMLTDRFIKSTEMIDVELSLFKNVKPIHLWSHVQILIGTYFSQAKIHLINKDRLEGGDTAIAQIHIEKPCICQYGDRFIIRNTSNDLTLGGGEIVDANPLHHRRRPEGLISALVKLVKGDISEKVSAEARKRMLPLSDDEVADILNVSKFNIWKAVEKDIAEDIAVISDKENVFLWRRTLLEKLEKKIKRHLQIFHKRNPIEERGRTFQEIMGVFGVHRDTSLEKVMHIVLLDLESRNLLRKKENTWALSSHNVVLTEQDHKHIRFVKHFISHSNMRVPLWSELVPASQNMGMSETKLKQVLSYLVNRKFCYNIEGNFIWSNIVDNSRITLLKYALEHEDGFTVATFRDLIDGNRKICLLMLAKFDSEAIITRKGDYRYITGKGMEFLKQNEK